MNDEKHLVIMQRPDTEQITAEVSGGTKVVIDKLFGPLIACNVRVWLDTGRGEWVIERECIRRRHTVPEARPGGVLCYSEGPAIFYEEVLRIDCQESIDFDEDEVPSPP